VSKVSVFHLEQIWSYSNSNIRGSVALAPASTKIWL